MISRDLELAVAKELNMAFKEIEERFETIIPSQVRSFLISLIRESLIFDEKRWMDQMAFDLMKPEYHEKVAGRCREAVNSVLEDAVKQTQYVSGYLSLIATVGSLFHVFCFYPFCKPEK